MLQVVGDLGVIATMTMKDDITGVCQILCSHIVLKAFQV